VAVGEVIVTARKRAERLIDVPLSISEVDTRTLNKYATSDITSLSQQVPSLNIQLSSTGQGGALAIHGLGSGVDDGIDQAVALNFDGIQVSRARFLRTNMFDMQDIEILKGPQALFFGKNSPAGVIALTTANPDKEFGGYLRTGYSPEYGKRYVEGAVSIPVTDTLAVRLAARLDHEDGFLTNSGGPQPNPFFCLPQPGACVNPVAPGNAQGSSVQDYNSYFGRATIVWTPSDHFTANLKLSYGQYSDNGDVANDQIYCNGAHPIESQAYVTAVETNTECKLDLNTTLGSWPTAVAAHWPDQLHGGRPFSYFNPFMASLNMAYKMDHLTFTSLTGVVSYTAVNEGNSDVGDFTVFGGANDEFSHQISQEFRVNSSFAGPINFLAGVFYEHSHKVFVNGGLVFPESSPFVENLGNGPGYDSRNGQSEDWIQQSPALDNTYSVFGQLTWRILDNLTVDGGARWIEEDKNAAVENVFVNNSIIAPVAAAVFLPEGDKLSAQIDAHNVSPEATLTYKPQRDMTLYFAYKTGFQSGGMSNPGLPGPMANANGLVFQPMTSKGEEAGFKFDLRQMGLSGSITGYDYNFDNLQVQSIRQVEVSPGTNTVEYTITNAASAYTRGVELEGAWRTPIEGFGVNGFLNYNVARYNSYPSAPCYPFQTLALGCVPVGGALGVNLSGATLPNAPKWTARLGLTYDHPIGDGLSFGAAFDANYESSLLLNQPADAFDTIPGSCLQGDRRCGLWLFNLSARVYTDDGRWEFAVIGKNIGGKIYPVADSTMLGAVTPDEQSVVIGNPLEVLFQLTYHFH